MVDFSTDFSQHRIWEMKEGVDEPAWVPPEPKWEAVTLAYTNENGIPIERPVWTRPILNGKIPLGAWVFDVKVRGFSEKGMSFLGELRRGVRASAQEVRAPAQEKARQGAVACPFCLEAPDEGLVQTGLFYRGGHDTILASMALTKTVGCRRCREARRFPDLGYMVPVPVPTEPDGRIDKEAIVAALWAELDRLEAKRG